MAEILNLRRARKRKARQEAEKSASSNRSLHGVPKSERVVAKARSEREKYDLEGRRLDR